MLILDTFNFPVTLPNGQERPYLDRLLPGLIAFPGMNVGLNSIIFAITDDRERGVLRRIRATHDWLHWITEGLPLTFLTDSVQQIANLNKGIDALGTDILGMTVWGAIATVWAIWKFRMA